MNTIALKLYQVYKIHIATCLLISVSVIHIMHVAEKEDVEYWDNPQNYLIPGNEEIGSHFVLHNFKATEPFNTPELKKLKVAGTLKYKVFMRNYQSPVC